MAQNSRTHTLVLRAKEGDKGAFEKIVTAQSDRVAFLIRHRLGPRLASKVDVADVVQETFLRAWQGLADFTWQGEAAFSTWLDTIAMTVLRKEIRRLRAQKRDPRRELSLARPVPTPDGSLGELVELIHASGTSPSRALRRDERFERLKEAMRRLSPDHRTVIHLVHIEELPVGEVARRMQRSMPAVSMLLYRALMKLKGYFKDTESLHLPHRRLEDDRDERSTRSPTI